MMTKQEPQTTAEPQLSSQASQGLQDNHQNNKGTDTPDADAGSISLASSDNRKVSREDIELVQNLIERCLQLYMNRGEVVRTLSNRARIEPGFTTLVWQKLEEENAEFFRAYYISTVNNLPMGYPVMQQPPMPATGQPHLDSMGLSNCHVVNGIPAPASFHPMRMNSGNEIVMENATSEPVPMVPPSSAMSEMAVSPASAASSNHFPFTPSDISGMGVDPSALDTTFTSDVVSTGGLQLGPDGGIGSSRDPARSLGLWNFSLNDLTADLSLTNMGDLGVLGEYTGSPFLPSDSDILLDSPEHDDMVEEFFADAIATGPVTQSDEEKTIEKGG